jgi:hypothetical protein
LLAAGDRSVRQSYRSTEAESSGEVVGVHRATPAHRLT